MTSIDKNVDNYTVSELLTILGIDQPTDASVTAKTNEYIERFQNENNESLVSFFQNMQTKLLQYVDQDEKGNEPLEYQPDNRQTEEWYKYEALPQRDQVQKDKITDRFQKIDVYDNNHVPMNRDHLGVNNVFDTKIAQDILNPNLENITSRFINLDSQFRQAAGGIESLSTDYTLDLSDPLTDVVSLRLYSIQIPFTWYAIDNMYGNTCFWVTNKGTSFQITVTPGNYKPSEFVSELNSAFQTANFTGMFTATSPVSYTVANGKIKINLNNFTDPNGNAIVGLSADTIFDETIHPYFTFFDFTGEKTCSTNCSSKNFSFDNTLGWIMGFRLPIEPILSVGNVPVAVLDLYGAKYLILVIDDYNQNHINNGLITITELSNKLPLPSYYNPGLARDCFITSPVQETATIANIQSSAINYNPQQTARVLPSAPRTLTQAQIYTINQIIKNRESNTTYRGKAPTASDTFALIPVKHEGMNTGEMYVEFSGSLQENKRIYFGPVDIDRMHIKLLDDRGYVLDLHGVDWCITLISENLYQY